MMTPMPFFVLHNIKQASKFVFFQLFICLVVLSATAGFADAQTPTPTPPPVSNDDFYQGIGARRQLPPGLLANDIGGGFVDTNSFTPPSHAQNFTLGLTGGFVYVPAFDFIGTDSFQYKRCNVYGICSQLATVTLQNANTKPFALPDVYFADVNGTVDTQFTPNLFLTANDFDLENDYLMINENYHNLDQTPSARPAHGWVSFYPNGRFKYQLSDTSFTGIDTFIYQVCDYYETYKLSCSTAKAFVVVGGADSSANLGESCPIVGQPVNVTNGNMWL